MRILILKQASRDRTSEIMLNELGHGMRMRVKFQLYYFFPARKETDVGRIEAHSLAILDG